MRKSRGMLMALAFSMGMGVRGNMVQASAELPTFLNYPLANTPPKPNKVSQSKRRKYKRQGK